MWVLDDILGCDGTRGQLDKKDQMPLSVLVVRRSHQLLAGGTYGFALIFSLLCPVCKQISFYLGHPFFFSNLTSFKEILLK